MFENPLESFANERLWAVVGVSADRSKFGNKIYRDLKAAGYIVQAVNPKLREVEGDPCYPSLAALLQKPTVVNLVIPPSATLAVIQDCIDLGIRYVWFQPGSEDDTAIRLAEDNGMTVVANACIMIEKHAWA